MKTKRILYVIALTFFFDTNGIIDNPHFYKATHFFGEPRLTKNWLTTFDFWIGTGKTTEGRNSCGMETNILNIFGEENIKQLAHGVPQSILDKSADSFLNNLWQKRTGDNFGKLRFSGRFKITEAIIDIQQNLAIGFFAELYIPIRKLEITDFSFRDLSTKANAGNANFGQWQEFIVNIKKNLQPYGIYLQNTKSTGIGDITLLGGYSYSYTETEYLDFIDATLKGGVLFPTGKQRNLHNVFSLPQGYDGHFGAPIFFDVAFGLYDWMTLGGYASVILFADKTKNVSMKTSEQQNGFIKLAHGTADVSLGTIWTAGAFFKAEHFLNGGLSLTLAYRFDKQNKTLIMPCDLKTFNFKIVNSDPMLDGWNMHTLNFIADYDFATIDCPNRPHVQVFIDLPIAGKRIFKTTMVGVGFGIDYAW